MKKASNTKKILFLSRLFYPHIGGVEKHVLKISQNLKQKGYEVTVITELFDKDLQLEQQYKGIRIIRIPISKNERRKKFEIWRWMIRNKKQFSNFDIIHIHDVFYWILPILIGLDKRKIYITFHGYESYPIKLKNKIQRKIAEKIAAGNICVGNFMKKWYGTTPTKVIYGACEPPKNVKKSQKKKNDLLFFGRLDDQTGIKDYYKAYLKLKKEYKNLTIKIIGEGKYRNVLKSLSIFKFKPILANDLLESRFILVSRYLSILEAMVNKRLVFAIYDNPLKKDYLYDSPFGKYVIICSSSEDVYKKIKFYLNNPDKEKKKINEAYNFAKKLTWEKLANDYLNLWQKS